MTTITLTAAQIARVLDALDMMAESDRDIDEDHEVAETEALIQAITSTTKQEG